MEIKQTRSLFRQTLSAWSDDYAPSMGAALAYYTMFSIAPLLLIIIAVAGWVFGADAARGEILAQLNGLMGKEGATMIEDLLKSVSEPEKSATAAAIGVVVLLLGATSVFGELQDALDRIWRAPVKVKTRGIFSLLRARALSFGMIIGIGFLLMVSLVVSAGLSAQIFLLGAEFTWVYAHARGSKQDKMHPPPAGDQPSRSTKEPAQSGDPRLPQKASRRGRT